MTPFGTNREHSHRKKILSSYNQHKHGRKYSWLSGVLTIEVVSKEKLSFIVKKEPQLGSIIAIIPSIETFCLLYCWAATIIMVSRLNVHLGAYSFNHYSLTANS